MFGFPLKSFSVAVVLFCLTFRRVIHIICIWEGGTDNRAVHGNIEDLHGYDMVLHGYDILLQLAFTTIAAAKH